MDYLDDLFTVLTEAGLGNYGETLFKGSAANFPEGSGPFISLIPTPGLGDEGTHNLSRDVVAYEQPSAQFVSRANDFQTAWDAAQVAYNALSFYDRFINGTWWRICRPRTEPYELGADAAGRMRIIFNLRIVKRVSPATSS